MKLGFIDICTVTQDFQMEVEGRRLRVAKQNPKKPPGPSPLSILTRPADDPSVTLKVSAPLLIF